MNHSATSWWNITQPLKNALCGNRRDVENKFTASVVVKNSSCRANHTAPHALRRPWCLTGRSGKRPLRVRGLNSIKLFKANVLNASLHSLEDELGLR